MTDKESLMRKAMRVKTAEVIDLVRVRPCLWDRMDPMYRNRVEKTKAWDEINSALEPSYSDMSRADRRQFGLMINRKWCNIRDCYKKYLNATCNGTNRSYGYSEKLTFLDSGYDLSEPCPKRKNFSSEAKDSTGDGEPDTEEQDEWLSEVFVDIDNTEAEPLPGSAKTIKTEFPRPKEGPEPEEGMVSVLAGLIYREDDEDRAFFKSITPTVKSLSDDDKFVFRIQVMKLLSAIKKKKRCNSSRKRYRSARESESE